MDFNDHRHRVLEIDWTDYVITLSRDDLWRDPCLKDRILNTNMNKNTHFDYTLAVNNLSINYCPNPNPDLLASRVGFHVPPWKVIPVGHLS